MRFMHLKPSRKDLALILAALAFLLLCLFLANDDGLYRQTIVQIKSVTNEPLGKTQGENGISENHYRQEITAVVKNGDRRGTLVTIENEYSESEVNSTQYRKGDKLFVGFQENGGRESVVILSVKRDVWLISISALFAFTLCLIYKGRGALILSSLLLNVFLMWLVLNYCEANQFSRIGAFFSRQWPLLIVLFCGITLLSVSGFHRQTLGAILSTLGTAFIIFLLYQLTINSGAAVPFDMMPDSFASLPVEDIYRFSVIAGSIGAIMDVCVTIHVSVGELVAAEGNTDFRAILASLRKIGADIMGTMINILFFSYLSASLPLEILKLNSGYSLGSILGYDLIFDFVRFLLGAIGIVLAIPISGGVALLLCRKERRQG